ncbi:hypothetical protein AB1K70_17640 [Bremerella sp. JC770]|uniref:hypothetical protein n=1 Tax=Bremerella sp. JC770 TaxID=3232137 RepID=UPI003457F1FD
MSQFTCQCCQQVFDKSSDPCFVIRVTAFLEIEPYFDETDYDDTDRDNLSVLADTLEQVYPIEDPTLHEDQTPQDFRLCRDCYQQYMRDPVGRESQAASISFSEN